MTAVSSMTAPSGILGVSVPGGGGGLGGVGFGLGLSVGGSDFLSPSEGAGKDGACVCVSCLCLVGGRGAARDDV